jgi:succinate dehydrogenase / fumarate reductase iron-sulfur subunit
MSDHVPKGPTPSTATFRVWRGDDKSGTLVDYTTPVEEGMVVLDAIHQIQA